MINKKTVFRFLVLAAMLTTLTFGSTLRVGLEDLKGPIGSGSDRDFNDIEILTEGVVYHLQMKFSFDELTKPVGYVETPAPDGYYFDYGVTSSLNPTLTFLGIQSAYPDVAVAAFTIAGGWVDILPGVPVTLVAPIGTTVYFGVRTPYETFWSDPGSNSDGLYHAVVSGEGLGEVPEPESGQLAIGGVSFMALSGLLAWKKRRGEVAPTVDTPDGKV